MIPVQIEKVERGEEGAKCEGKRRKSKQVREEGEDGTVHVSGL